MSLNPCQELRRVPHLEHELRPHEATALVPVVRKRSLIFSVPGVLSTLTRREAAFLQFRPSSDGKQGPDGRMDGPADGAGLADRLQARAGREENGGRHS